MGYVRLDVCSQSGRWLCRDVEALFVGIGVGLEEMLPAVHRLVEIGHTISFSA